MSDRISLKMGAILRTDQEPIGVARISLPYEPVKPFPHLAIAIATGIRRPEGRLHRSEKL